MSCRCRETLQCLHDQRRQACTSGAAGGIWGLEPFHQGHYSIGILVAIAFAKLVAISITVLAGFRGGFIFPIFLAGTALGRGLAQVKGFFTCHLLSTSAACRLDRRAQLPAFRSICGSASAAHPICTKIFRAKM